MLHCYVSIFGWSDLLQILYVSRAVPFIIVFIEYISSRTIGQNTTALTKTEQYASDIPQFLKLRVLRKIFDEWSLIQRV